VNALAMKDLSSKISNSTDRSHSYSGLTNQKEILPPI
ncbi:MAG: hypothetical protein ACJAV7_002585, partial [Flavobacteriales bacterium]